MNSQNGSEPNIDWQEIYLMLYAYTDDLLKKKAWFRGSKADTYLKGKQIHDYVSEAIEKYLTHPEKFDESKKRSLCNYLKLHIIRTLVGNDSKSLENRTTKDVFAIAEQKEENDDDSSNYLDSILPYAEAFFDQEIDCKKIIAEIEKEIAEHNLLEEIFLGIRCYGMKRSDVIKEFGMTPSDFDNGLRRLSTILNNVAKKYEIKKLPV